MKNKPTSVETCLNCGHAVDGNFCPECGQKAVDLHQPFRVLFKELFEDLFAFDTRFLRTLVPLLFRPGFLSREYLEGKRVRYTPPFRLYLFISIAVMVLLSLQSPRPLFVMIENTPPAESGIADSGKAGPGAPPARSAEAAPKKSRPSTGPAAVLLKGFDQAGDRPDEFGRIVNRSIPRVYFVVLPLFALLMRLFFRRLYFYDHLIFSLHFHAFGFIILFIVTTLDNLFGKGLMYTILALPFAVWAPAYYFFSLKRFTGQGWVWILLKGPLLFLLYAACFILLMGVMMAFVLWRLGSA